MAEDGPATDGSAPASTRPATRQPDGQAARTESIIPPRKRDRATSWILLLLCLLAALPPLMIELGKPHVFDAREASYVRKSFQTHNHHIALESNEAADRRSMMETLKTRLQPYTESVDDLDDAPGLTWLHTFALWPMADEQIERQVNTRQAVFRTRIVSVVMALVLIGGVYWAGNSIGGVTTAAYSALLCAGSFVLIYYARIAMPTIPHIAFAVLAIASALWAMRPLRPSSSVWRQLIGWGLSGVMLGLATLTAGPAAGPAITFPLILIVLLCNHRLTNMLALLAAHGLAALLLAPWAAHVHNENPDIWAKWLTQLVPTEPSLTNMIAHASTRAYMSLIILMPWTIWLFGALIQPFSKSSSGARQRQFIGWGWFLSTWVVLLLLPSRTFLQFDAEAVTPWQSNSADLLLLVPVAAILIGELFSQYVDLAGQGRFPRSWRLLRWPHVALLILFTLSAGALTWLQPQLIETGWIHSTVVSPFTTGFWVGLTIALLAVVGLSIKWLWEEYPGKALVCWAAWSILLASVLVIPASRSESMRENHLAIPPIEDFLETIAQN